MINYSLLQIFFYILVASIIIYLISLFVGFATYEKNIKAQGIKK
tara:strand:+ start:2095 stop:2226 length:132 start_codon:yes stop_codon:yes gene_type:complete